MTGKSGGALIEAAAKVVAAGLAPAHPELDRRCGARSRSERRGAQRGGGGDPAHRRAEPDGDRRGGSPAGGEPGATPGDQLGAIYGALATGCGYSYRVIDEHDPRRGRRNLRLLGTEPAGASDAADDRADARLDAAGRRRAASRRSPPPRRPASRWREAAISACRRRSTADALRARNRARATRDRPPQPRVLAAGR